MDPLSITAAALGFAGICVRILRNINDAVARLQDVPQNLSDLGRRMELMITVLSEVDSRLRTNFEEITSTPQEQRIVSLLGGCRNTLQRVNSELKRLEESSPETWIAKATLWREDRISRMVASLEQEWHSIQGILEILRMWSEDNNKRSMFKMQASIDDLNERLSASLLPSSETRFLTHRELVQSPTPDDDQTLVEGTPSRESSPSSTEFSFDDKLINTKVYRKALARLSLGKKRRLSSSSQVTAIEARRVPLGDIKNTARGMNGKAEEQRDGEPPSKKRREDENWVGYFEDYVGIFEDPET